MGSRTLRYLNTPQAITVETDNQGAPRIVTTAGCRHAVIQIRESWVVNDRWWTERPIARRYFDVVLRNGRRLEIFHSPDGWSQIGPVPGRR